MVIAKTPHRFEIDLNTIQFNEKQFLLVYSPTFSINNSKCFTSFRKPSLLKLHGPSFKNVNIHSPFN